MKVRTLLAVTLATTTPAAAGPEHDHTQKPTVSTARPAAKPAPRVTPSTIAPQAASTNVAATPRTLPTGSPACGNVQAKGERDAKEACLRAEAARAAKLASGSANATPAPNAASAPASAANPAPRPTAAPAAAPTAVVTRPVLANAPTTTVAAKPRTLPTGSPACGNVQAKIPASKRAEIEACLRAEAAKADAAAKAKK